MAKRILRIDIADWQERTRALTAAETGILTRLLVADAEHDGIPADAGALCKIGKVSREKWDAGLGKKMAAFFTVSGSRVVSNIASGIKTNAESEKVKSICEQVKEYWTDQFFMNNGAYPVLPTAATCLAVAQSVRRLTRADAKRYTLDTFKDIIDFGFARNCPTLASMLTEYAINTWMQETGEIQTGHKMKKRERDKFFN